MLATRGWLLLAFQTGAPTRDITEAFGKTVRLRFLRHDVATVQDALREAGFAEFAAATRQPDPAHQETAAQAFIIARKAE